MLGHRNITAMSRGADSRVKKSVTAPLGGQKLPPSSPFEQVDVATVDPAPWLGRVLAASTGVSISSARTPPSAYLHHRDAVVLQRERADTLARGGEERIQHGRCRHADRRLADPAPEPA